MTTENATRPEAAAADVPVVTCRLCGSTELRSFLDLGATPPCELFLTADAASRSRSRPTRCTCGSASDCLLAQLPPLITPEETFTEYAYFSSFSTSWVEHARRFVDGAVERLGLGPDSFVVEVASNDGYLLQHVVERGHPLPGRRAVGQRRRGGPGRRACPRSRRSSPRRPARQVRARARPGRPGRGQQRLRAHPRRGRLHRGPAGAGRRRRLGVDRGAAPAHAGGAQPVRHDLPRALPVLHGAHRRSGRSPAAGSTLVDVELLPTHGGSIRLWARPAEVAGEPSAAGARRAGRRGGGRAAHRRRATTGSPRRSPACATTCVAFLIEARRAGQDGGRLRRPGQGQHAAQLLRHPARPARLHGRPQPLQARPVHPGHPHPDPAARADRRRTGPTTCCPAVEPARRAHRAAVLRPRLGRQAGLPDPAPRGRSR